MPALLFACPSTGEKFASGIHTDAQSLALVAQLPVTLTCPICGRTHQLTAKRGELEEPAGLPPLAPSHHGRRRLHMAP